MNRARVMGEVWATRKCPGLEGHKLLLLAVLDGEATTGEVVVAIDTLAARVGEQVLIAYGSGARNVLYPGPGNEGVLADAAVAQIIDRTQPTGNGGQGEG